MPNKAYLKQALASTYKVEAIVKNAVDADMAAATATSFWLERHNGKNAWHIITIDLTLSTHLVSSMGPSFMSQRSLGLLQRYTLHDFDRPNTLVIYASDRYTETWVHEWTLARSTADDSRILNIVRNDPGAVIDLGESNLLKANPAE